MVGVTDCYSMKMLRSVGARRHITKRYSIEWPPPSEQPTVTLTVRMIMSGKEVGSIIGKGGEIINGIREESGAKIHISDGSVPERIVTVTGSTDGILKAFNLVSKKLEDDGGGRGGGGERQTEVDYYRVNW